MSRLSNNIKYLRNKKKKTQESLADDLTISRSKLCAYEDGRSEPSIETLIRLSEYFKLPIDSLIKTDLTLSKNESFIDIGGNRVLFPVVINENNKDLIEVVPLEASAGYLQGYSDTEYISNLPIMNLNFLPTGKYRAFPIMGDSMLPTVRTGDFVVGSFKESIAQLKNGNCYVILTKEDGLVYKRVFLDKIDENIIILSSDNKIYEPFEIHTSELLEIWELTVNLSIGQYDEEELNPSHIMNLLRSFKVDLKKIQKKVNA